LGTPRRKSLKRVEPAISSRIKTIVHRVHKTSAAIARGQNCLYPAFCIFVPSFDLFPRLINFDPIRLIFAWVVLKLYHAIQNDDWIWDWQFVHPVGRSGI
jgi:hypothetical protein